MHLKPLFDLLTTMRALPPAPAASLPATAPSVDTTPRVLRRAMPSQGSPHRQMELDFRPASGRPRGALLRAVPPKPGERQA